QPLKLGYRTVMFQFIDNLSVGGKANVVIDRGDKVESQKRDMMAALEEECEAKARADKTALPFGHTVRLVIKYQTFDGRKRFSTDIDLTYYLGKRKLSNVKPDELMTFLHQGFRRVA